MMLVGGGRKRRHAGLDVNDRRVAGSMRGDYELL